MGAKGTGEQISGKEAVWRLERIVKERILGNGSRTDDKRPRCFGCLQGLAFDKTNRDQLFSEVSEKRGLAVVARTAMDGLV